MDDETKTPPPPLPTSLEELIDAYADDPESWARTAQVATAAKQDEGNRTWGSSRGPLDLSAVDDAATAYAQIADRLEAPAHLVVRVRRKPHATITIAVGALANEATWRAFRSTPPPPPPTSTVPPPPTDLMSVVATMMANMMQAQQDNQRMQNEMLREMQRQAQAPRTDPTVDVLRAELERTKLAKETDTDKLIAMGKEMATAASSSVPWDGIITASTPLVSGLVDLLKASADEKREKAATDKDIAKAKADKEASEAEAEVLRLTIKLQRESKGLPADDADDVDVKAAATQ